jgi:hypothetical protein
MAEYRSDILIIYKFTISPSMQLSNQTVDFNFCGFLHNHILLLLFLVLDDQAQFVYVFEYSLLAWVGFVLYVQDDPLYLK